MPRPARVARKDRIRADRERPLADWPLTCIPRRVLLEAALLSIAIVRSVSIPGTQLDVKLATQVGRPFDAASVSEDLRALWNLGRFSDVRVETEEDESG